MRGRRALSKISGGGFCTERRAGRCGGYKGDRERPATVEEVRSSSVEVDKQQDERQRC